MTAGSLLLQSLYFYSGGSGVPGKLYVGVSEN